MLIDTAISLLKLCIKQTGTWCVLQGSVETPIKWGGQHCYRFAVNSMAYPYAKFYLHTSSFDKVITKEKGYKLLVYPVYSTLFTTQVNMKIVITKRMHGFLPCDDYASSVLSVKISFFVCPSVCLSNACIMKKKGTSCRYSGTLCKINLYNFWHVD